MSGRAGPQGVCFVSPTQGKLSVSADRALEGTVNADTLEMPRASR